MIWGFVSNILASLDAVFSKKAFLEWRIPQFLFWFLWSIGWFLVAICLVVFKWIDKSVFLDWRVIGWILLLNFICMWYDYLDQKVYRRNTIASLLPYSNLNNILAIIAGYFIFKDASIIAVWIAIFIVILTVVTSLDFKSLEFPKGFVSIIWSQILKAWEILLTAIALKSVADSDYFVLYYISVLLIYIIPIIWRKEYRFLPNPSIVFYRDRWISGVSFCLSWLLYLFLVTEFGLIVSMLISFLWDGLTMFLSFLILREKPTKKDIIMFVVISVLVGVGFYFK